MQVTRTFVTCDQRIGALLGAYRLASSGGQSIELTCSCPDASSVFGRPLPLARIAEWNMQWDTRTPDSIAGRTGKVDSRVKMNLTRLNCKWISCPAQ